MKLYLPLFISRKAKPFWGLIAGLSTTFLYLTTNHYHLYPPQFLPLTSYDQAIPFIPHTVWIYSSEYLLFFVTCLFVTTPLNLTRLFFSFMSIQVISCSIFVLWPTTYPRELFPLSSELDQWTYLIFSTLRTTDSPANCCPSLHVSSVLICAFAFFQERKKWFLPMLLWACLISFATLTTKQHYIVDVLVGFLLAIVCYWVFHIRTNYVEK